MQNHFTYVRTTHFCVRTTHLYTRLRACRILSLNGKLGWFNCSKLTRFVIGILRDNCVHNKNFIVLVYFLSFLPSLFSFAPNKIKWGKSISSNLNFLMTFKNISSYLTLKHKWFFFKVNNIIRYRLIRNHQILYYPLSFSLSLQ